MKEFKIIKDRDGRPRAIVTPANAPLAWLLEQDIQRNKRLCNEIISACDRVASQGGIWEFSGNAHSVTINKDDAIIENDYSSPPISCSIRLPDFIAAVRSWLGFIDAAGR